MLAIKRFTRALVNFLTRQGRCLTGRARSIDWPGRRDHAFLLFAVQTGRLDRGSQADDLFFGTGAPARHW
ncbi:hypothetical protein F2981_31150 (plasmid) [Sinorhizobium meliloti]|nr:hypothetical protein [Sinorhizobium meliloti]